MDRRWLVLGALFLGRACMGLQLQSIAALAEPLRADLGFSYTQIGVLVGLFLLPGLVVAFPTTMLGRRFGERRMACPAVLLMAVGSGMAVAASSFEAAAAARLVAGVGGILVNVVFTRLVADLFVGYRLNLAMGLLMSSWPLGLAVATVTFPFGATMLGWRETLAGLTLLTAFSGLLIAYVFYRPFDRETRDDPVDRRSEPPRPTRIPRLHLDRRALWLSVLSGVAWATFTAAGIVFLSFAPSFLMEKGWSLTGANAVTSLIVWGGVVATPLGGWLADRYNAAHAVVLLGTAASALCLVLIPAGGPAILLTLLLGVVWGLPPGPYMGMLQAAVSPAARAAAYGVYFTLFYGGIGTLPGLAGWLRDGAEQAAAPLYFAAAMLGVSVIAIFVFRRNSREPAAA